MKNVNIISGAKDWQIFQQNDGFATITLFGSYDYEQNNDEFVFARVVRESDQSVVINWTQASFTSKNKFEVTIANVPVGGLYRIETCFSVIGQELAWASHGGMIFHIGVGDLYVIAGQSNSSGYGKTPAEDTPELGVHLYRNSESWDLAVHPMNDSTNTNHEVNAEGANPGTSPYLSFGRLLKRRLNYPIGLIQTALGGSSISMWNPDGEKNLYTNMIEVIDRATNSKNKVAGILWYQGCSDTGVDDCHLYAKRFEYMVSSLRSTLQMPELPFLTIQLNKVLREDNFDTNYGWSTIREVQRKAKAICGVYVTPTLDMTLSDSIHNSSASNITIGERLGNQALEQIYKLNANGSAPDLSKVCKLSDNCIRISFTNVYQALVSLDLPLALMPFCVSKNENEAVLITGCSFGKDYIDLTVDASIDDSFTVSCAFGATPMSFLPFDRASGLPILSFYKVCVEI